MLQENSVFSTHEVFKKNKCVATLAELIYNCFDEYKFTPCSSRAISLDYTGNIKRRKHKNPYKTAIKYKEKAFGSSMSFNIIKRSVKCVTLSDHKSKWPFLPHCSVASLSFQYL